MGKGNRFPVIQVTNRYGVAFYASLDNYIDAHVIKCGYYESEVLEAILPYLGTGSVLWDIGANFGLHAITAKALNPEATVVCFEPFPLMAGQIHANMLLNELDVIIVNIALTEAPGYRTLHVVNHNPGMSTLKPWTGATYSSQVLCWGDRGDDLVSAKLVPQPTVIKLDVEGSEPEVLAGLFGVLKCSDLRCVVFEEASDLLSHADNLLYEQLANAGFKISRLTRREPTHHNLDNFIATRS